MMMDPADKVPIAFAIALKHALITMPFTPRPETNRCHSAAHGAIGRYRP